MKNNINDDSKLSLSTVTPVYSGANYLEALIAELKLLRDTWATENAPVSLDGAIFVNDGAIDESPLILDELASRYDWVHVIHLSRNFGQHSATMAGILHTSGDWVVTLDEDLQHQPKDIRHLFASVAKSGYDVVYANPRAAVHESWYRDFGSRGFKSLMMRLTGNQFIGIFNSFRLMRGSIARATASVCSHQTYLDMALSWMSNWLYSGSFLPGGES